MRVGILAEKIGMSRFYDNHRVNQAVTLAKFKAVSCSETGLPPKQFNSPLFTRSSSKTLASSCIA